MTILNRIFVLIAVAAYIVTAILSAFKGEWKVSAVAGVLLFLTIVLIKHEYFPPPSK